MDERLPPCGSCPDSAFRPHRHCPRCWQVVYGKAAWGFPGGHGSEIIAATIRLQAGGAA